MSRTTLYIVRHGETDNNRSNRFIGGATDHPLNERGMAQAASLRARFADIPLAAVYSSPLLRAKMTAEQIRGDHDIPLVTDDGLLEIGCGEWEGHNREEIETLWPGMLALWQFSPDKLKIPGGETFAEVQARTVDTVVRIIRRERGKSIALSSHLLAIQLIITGLLNIPINRVWEMPRLDNTAVSTILIEDNGDIEITDWNDHDHLPDSLYAGPVQIAGFTSKGDRENIFTIEGKYHFDRFDVNCSDGVK